MLSSNPHRLYILERWFWELVLFKLFNDDQDKCNKKFYNKLINCLGTGWENENEVKYVFSFSYWFP